MRIHNTVFLASALLAASAWAEEVDPSSGSFELGINKTTGNTRTESGFARILYDYKHNRWTHETKFEAARNADDGELTKQTFLADYQANYDIVPDERYSFGSVRYLDDRFGSFRKQVTAVAGYGWTVVSSDRAELELEAGAGYRRSELQFTEETVGEPIASGRLRFHYKLSETAELNENFRVQSGADNTFLENEISARVQVVDALGLKISYIVRHNTDVPELTENTDTITAVTLDYQF